MKKLAVVIGLLLVLAGCTDADVASANLSKEADMFRIQRRVVFYNGITDSYMLTIEGRCSLGNFDEAGELSVTCKVAEGQYKKHFLGLSDNVTYFVEQLDPVPVDIYRYKVVFKPSVIVPDIENGL
jgi:hypothetical protein